MARKPQYRKPLRPVKPATPNPGEERVRRDNPNAVPMDGKDVETLSNAMFTVELDNGHAVLGHLGGKMRTHDIRVLPGDRVVVLSPSQGFETGAPDNFEQPHIFFHARRKGVVLAADRQTGEHLLEAVEAADARWFVNLKEVNHAAVPSFWTEIESRMTPAAEVDGYTIYSIDR